MKLDLGRFKAPVGFLVMTLVALAAFVFASDSAADAEITDNEVPYISQETTTSGDDVEITIEQEV